MEFEFIHKNNNMIISEDHKKTDEFSSLINMLLIGDDDVELLRLWDMMDKSNSGDYNFKIANNIDDILKCAENSRLDLFLIDFNFAHDNNYGLVNILREIHGESAFIFLLDENDPDIISNAIEAGIDDCLVKSRTTEFKLEKAIKFAVGRHRKMKNPENNFFNQSEAKYKAIFENVNDAIFLILDGKFVDCNSRALEMFKCTREQIINAYPDQFSPDLQPNGQSSREAVLEKFEAALNGVPQIFEWKHCGYDRTEFDANVSLNTIKLSNQTYIMAIVHDITQRKMTERMLRENEEKFRNIYTNAPVGLFRSRVSDGKLLECNARFAKIFGFNYVEEALMNFLENGGPYFNPNDREHMIKELKAVGEIKNFEARFKSMDGQIKWIRYSARLNAEKGFLEGIATDITLEKRAFDMLRKSNQRIRNILESISDGFYTLDNNLEITFINRAAEKILGCRGGKVLGMNLFQALPEFRDEHLVRDIQKVLRTKTASLIELNLSIGHDCDWYEIRIYSGDDGLSVYFREITDRKHFEQMLLDKERKMRSILATAAEGILIIDKDGLIESYNPAAKKIFAYDHKNMNNEQISILIPDFLTEITRLLQANNNNNDGRISNLELTGKRIDGSRFPLKLSVSEMTLNGQKWYTVIIHDLTEEREHMRRLIEMDKFSAIGTLAAGVAHEFKNHLAGIIGNASFGLEYLDNQDGLELARETLQQVIDIGESANRVTLSLLTYSLNNHDEKTREDLNTLIEEVLRIVARDMRAKNIEIECHLETLPKMNVFAGRIQQMILNFILNAKQAIEGKGTIRVSTSVQDEFIVFEVQDNGCGIPEENLNRIFDPFFSTRGVWGAHMGNSTGLGLSICRNIAIEHDGEITVSSKIDEGSTFTVRLPIQHNKVNQSDNIPDLLGRNITLFSTDESTIQFFAELSHQAGTELTICGQIKDLEDISTRQELVVLDAGYPGMGELYRLGNCCLKEKLRYIIVNSGKYPEYQLEELLNDAETVVQGLPEINSIIKENA